MDVPYSRHHRKPESQGGTSWSPFKNICWIPHTEHVNWHRLFKDYNHLVIAFLINQYYLPECRFTPYPVRERRLLDIPSDLWVRKILPQKWEPRYDAWAHIFDGMHPIEIEAHMALRLLDPEIRFHVAYEPKIYSFPLAS